MKVAINILVDDGWAPHQLSLTVEQAALDAVLFDFNPTSNDDVATIKALCGGVIEMCERQRRDGTNAQQKRNAAIAITEIEGAQMRAVKALFAK